MAQKDFEKYEQLLRTLLWLEVKSDKIRDEMDEPWDNMTEEEREEIEKITKELSNSVLDRFINGSSES